MDIENKLDTRQDGITTKVISLFEMAFAMEIAAIYLAVHSFHFGCGKWLFQADPTMLSDKTHAE